MKAFLFDMDGVLVDNSEYHVRAWTEYSRLFGRELTPDEITCRLGFNNREYMRFILDREPTTEETERATREKEALYREIYRPFLALPPGLLDFLEVAHRAEISCAVATSAPKENVDFVLDGLSLRSHFCKVVDSGCVKRGKPAPDIYLRAAEEVGVAPAECMVFEDALAGIEAGHAAGMRVVALTTSYPAEVLASKNPEYTVSSFMDCKALFPDL